MKRPTTVDRSKRHEVVLSYLEQRIINGELVPGEHLPAEGSLAEMFNVSSRTVREALQILETKGLIARRHGGLAEVVRNDFNMFIDSLSQSIRSLFSTDQNYLIELMTVRRMIEVQVAEQIASGGYDLSDLDKALAEIKAAVEAEDAERVVDCDTAFHVALMRCFGNSILTVLYDNLFGMISEEIKATIHIPIRTLHDVYLEHEELLRVLKTSQPAEARRAFAQHIDGSIVNLHTVIGDGTLGK